MHVFVFVNSFFKGHLAEIAKRQNGNDEYPALELFHEWCVHLSVPIYSTMYILVNSLRLPGRVGIWFTVHKFSVAYPSPAAATIVDSQVCDCLY